MKLPRKCSLSLTFLHFKLALPHHRFLLGVNYACLESCCTVNIQSLISSDSRRLCAVICACKEEYTDFLRQLTLIHNNEVDWCAVVLVLLFGIASKTNVLAAVLKSDVPQQDGDVISLIFPYKLYPFSIYGDIWDSILRLYCRVTHLKAPGNCQGSEEGQGLSRNKTLFTIEMLPLLLNCQLK